MSAHYRKLLFGLKIWLTVFSSIQFTLWHKTQSKIFQNVTPTETLKQFNLHMILSNKPDCYTICNNWMELKYTDTVFPEIYTLFFFLYILFLCNLKQGAQQKDWSKEIVWF